MSHKHRMQILTGAVLAVGIGCGTARPRPPSPPEPPKLDLDHFLCYEGRGGDAIDETIELEDQFDRLGHERDKVNVGVPFALCNPVAKTPVPDSYGEGGEPQEGRIQNGDHHLVAYRIETEKNRAWSANFFNQITPDGGRLGFRRAQFLLVPSRKLQPGDHGEPKGLDHFKCYVVADPPPSPGKFDLLDQFEVPLKGVELTGARAVCAPADKFREYKDSEPARSDVHLVCYGLERQLQRSVRYTNQFERPGNLLLNRIFGLCVPSRKEGVRRGGGGAEG